jgi:hypothetical protein
LHNLLGRRSIHKVGMSMLCENSIVAGNGSPRLPFFRYSTNKYSFITAVLQLPLM